MLTDLLVFNAFWNCFGTVGEHCWNYWGTFGELFGNFWGTLSELLQRMFDTFLELIKNNITFCWLPYLFPVSL